MSNVSQKTVHWILKIIAAVVLTTRTAMQIPKRFRVVFQQPIFYQSIKKLELFLSNILSYRKKLIRKISKAFKIVLRFAQRGETLLGKLKNLLLSLAQQCKHAFKQLLQKGKKPFRKAKEFFGRGIVSMQRGIFKLFVLISSFLSELSCLLCYWMQQVREVTISLLKFK